MAPVRPPSRASHAPTDSVVFLWERDLPAMGIGIYTSFRSYQTPWRGSLLPLGCAAAPIGRLRYFRKNFATCFRAAMQPSGSKLPRHNSGVCYDEMCRHLCRDGAINQANCSHESRVGSGANSASMSLCSSFHPPLVPPSSIAPAKAAFSCCNACIFSSTVPRAIIL